jgi:hypothetical protein
MPDIREQLVTGPLQDVSIKYRNGIFVGDQIFRIIDTSDPKMNIYKYLKSDWFRDEAKIRGRGARASRSTFKLTPIPYNTQEYAFASEVADEDRRNAASRMAPPLEPDQDAIEFCSDKIDLSKELRIAALVKATGWSGQAAGGEDAEGLWAPPGATNTFMTDVEARKETIRAATGFRPNVLMIDSGTFAKIKLVEEVLDRIKYGGGEADPAKVNARMIAALFELDEVLIGEAIYNSAKETKAGSEFTSVNIWENTATKGMAFLFSRPPRLGLKIPMPGVQVRLKYESGQVRRTTTWREAPEHQDVYEVAEETDIVATGADLGFMWKDTLLT